MSPRRSLLLNGLGLTLRRAGAFLWTYAFNIVVALLFALRFGAQADSVLTHSLAAQRLAGSFDLGAVVDTLNRIGGEAPDAGSSSYVGLAVYFIVYFVLVPGTFFCYQAGAPAKLSTLLSQGLLHFWRFVRITLLTALVSGLVLGPLFALEARWSSHVDNHFTGNAFRWHTYPVLVVIFLIAALLRLYFDLVLAYTIQIGLQIRPNGKPDRRVRRTLLPALRVLRENLLRTFGTFVLLTLLGLAALILTWLVGLHTLAQPRVWPLFLLAQTGLFINLFTRFWQRGAETILTLDFPILPPAIPVVAEPVVAVPVIAEPIIAEPVLPPYSPAPSREIIDNPIPSPIADPIPDPEPASPSLDRPDENLYHHE